MDMTNANSTTGLRRLALAALAIATLAHSALAGTYSIVSLDWYPSTAPATPFDGAYMGLGSVGSSLDVSYGIDKSLAAPAQGTSLSASPMVSANVRWVVRWTAAPGDTSHPYQPNGTLQYRGSASATASAASIVMGANSGASVTESDVHWPAAAGPVYNPDYFGTTASASGGTPTTYYSAAVGTSPFTLVAGTTDTYEATIIQPFSCQGSLSASGVKDGRGRPSATASAYLKMDVVARLTELGGQRLQPDL